MTTITPIPAPLDFMGNLFTWHVDTPDLALAEVVAQPGGEPPLHVHAREDEVYYVLEGELTFQRGEERIDATAGDVIVLPRGVVHGFAVRSSHARVLLVCTPGGLDAPFRELSAPADEGVLPAVPQGPPPAEAVAALEATFGAYGVTFVGPPLPALLGS